ncbi:MAG: flavodoxin-dependent (E)-4-hydroxy-3-methylbut-2-enyl-diphosphate synthase [Planctomycetes bacterium]|nr:flavodoxin-dependent (E)-4-hydroxy-3-methylbut-2-enyl-diphosphate synthase [Planctomycetota bacterium]
MGIKRRKTRVVKVGNVKIGGKNPIVVQSMTKVATTDVGRCLGQIRRLADAGCGLVRLAVPTGADAIALSKIVAKSPIPLVADIHFSPRLAIASIEAGAAKIRLNPGNIKDRKDILRIIDAAKLHGTAIRAGVNEASIRDLKNEVVPEAKRVSLMLREIKKYVRLFEKRGFTNLVLSAKSADTVRTIEINRAISDTFDYPVHVGLTHAGLPEDAKIPSAIAIGTLLAEGIGDTIRVSLAGGSVEEVRFGLRILGSLGLAESDEPELTVCPTCGRCKVDVVRLAKQVKRSLRGVSKPVKVAVMGCIVNGPGEAQDADLAVCAAMGKGYIYRKGKKIATMGEDELLDALTAEIKKL